MDSYLTKYSKRYDKWLQQGKVTFTSKVIPIKESLDAKQWVIPTQQAISILDKAKSFALTECACRINYQC
ncbi:MAG: hypothetical protein GY707_13230, partial [Desulfobacteraceae bacterium]|nr:hypothetical protein [Desulfobacteraceae bacterium]